MRTNNDEILRAQEFITAQIAEHRANVFSDDPAKQLSSTQHFRRLLSIGNSTNDLFSSLSLEFMFYTLPSFLLSLFSSL
jgi:hypothetical protein